MAAAATSSLPVLRIAIGVIFGIPLDMLDATLGSVRFCSPALVQQLYLAEFLQRQTAPDSRSCLRPRDASALSSELIAEHAILTRMVVSQHVGTQQSRRAIIDCRYRPALIHGRQHQAVDFLR